MSFGAWFRYVPGGPLYPYSLDYSTDAEAQAAATWLEVNGYWHQRPDDPATHSTALPVATTTTAEASEPPF